MNSEDVEPVPTVTSREDQKKIMNAQDFFLLAGWRILFHLAFRPDEFEPRFDTLLELQVVCGVVV